MNYSQAKEYLFSRLPAYHRVGKAAYKNNLDNTIALDEYLGHPHSRFRTIHVAGTNGKGSVSHMLASILQEAGYSVGLYTSPHLKDFRERIRVNGKMIPRKEVIAFITNHSPVIERIEPSFFELSVAMAFDYFSRSNVDVAVIETGLGGRLDSTNIIIPELSVITNIGHDHMDLLGDTIEKIASEKAGIIKKGVPVVIGETDDRIKEIFTRRASGNACDIYFADRHFACSLDDTLPGAALRKYVISDLSNGNITRGTCPLGGDYQVKNLVTVFQACSVLQERFPGIAGKVMRGIRNVISNTGLMGRWQVVSKRPLVICDTGHNMEGIREVMKQIARINPARIHFVIGFVNDKDLSSVLPLFPRDGVYYFTRANVSRALDEKVLGARASDHGLRGECYPTVTRAFEAARKNAAENDLIFIGGSTFIVAEAV
jgi:dihydrofolate synthase/folylpolyglutamate synthase